MTNRKVGKLVLMACFFPYYFSISSPHQQHDKVIRNKFPLHKEMIYIEEKIQKKQDMKQQTKKKEIVCCLTLKKNPNRSLSSSSRLSLFFLFFAFAII